MTQDLDKGAVKTCAACKYADFRSPEYGGGTWCVHPKFTAQVEKINEESSSFSPIIGNYLPDGRKKYPECSLARSNSGACGPDGKLWSEKVGFFKRVFW